MPDTTAEQAAAFFDRVQGKLDQIEISIDGRPRLTLSFSCGLAAFKADYLPEDLIEEADHSLYSAKPGAEIALWRLPPATLLISRAVH